MRTGIFQGPYLDTDDKMSMSQIEDVFDCDKPEVYHIGPFTIVIVEGMGEDEWWISTASEKGE